MTDGTTERVSIFLLPKGHGKTAPSRRPVLSFQNGVGNLPFTNFMEYDNQTRPDLKRQRRRQHHLHHDGGKRSRRPPTFRDYNYSDGREVFKYGSNPSDNDTDGDMLPDWYEYKLAWNESNDNFSSYLDIRVVWIDVGDGRGRAPPTPTPACHSRKDGSGGTLARPDTEFTWFHARPSRCDRRQPRSRSRRKLGLFRCRMRLRILHQLPGVLRHPRTAITLRQTLFVSAD